MKEEEKKEIEDAKRLLISKGYYVNQYKPYCYWSILDVEHTVEQLHQEDKFTDISYTEDLGEAVMDLVERRFDCEYGVTWDHVESATEEILNSLKI